MGIRAYIFKTPLTADCANGGISERVTEVCIINAEGDVQPTPDCPAVELVAMDLSKYVSAGNGKNNVHVYAKPVELGKRHSMMGGTFIYGYDSRFSEAVEKLGGVGNVAIGLHDRTE